MGEQSDGCARWSRGALLGAAAGAVKARRPVILGDDATHAFVPHLADAFPGALADATVVPMSGGA